MNVRLSERVSKFLNLAEHTGELRRLEETAERANDTKRVELVAQHAALPVREKVLAAPTKTHFEAVAALERAEAGYRKAKLREADAAAALRGAEYELDAKKADLRRELWNCAPSVIPETRAALGILRENVRNKWSIWAESAPEGWRGAAGGKLASDIAEVTAAASELQGLQDTVTDLAYRPLKFVEIEDECEAALAKGKTIAAKFIDRTDIQRLLREDVAATA